MSLKKFEREYVSTKKDFLAYIFLTFFFFLAFCFIIYESFLLHWMNVRQPSYIYLFIVIPLIFFVFNYLYINKFQIFHNNKKSISIGEDKIIFNEKETVNFHKIDKILIRKRRKILETLELYILYKDSERIKEFKQNLDLFKNPTKLINEFQKFCEKNNIKFVNEVDRVNEFYKVKKQKTGMISIAMFFICLILIIYLPDENFHVRQFMGLNPFIGEDTKMIQKITWYENGQNEFEIVYISIERELMIISFMHYDQEGNLLGDSFYYDKKGKLWKWKLNDPDDPSKGGEWILGKLS